MLGYGSFTGWGTWIISAMGVVALAIFVHSMLAVLKPEWGKLGKSVLPYSDGTINTGIQSMFARIDKDMELNGKKFGYVWVGKEWVLGGEAMSIERIRGIFSFKIWKCKQYEYAICLVDDRRNVQTTNLTREKHLDELYDYLTDLLPNAAYGHFDDYLAFIAKDETEMEEFNEGFLHGAPVDKGEFVLTESDNIPTSLVTSEGIRRAVNALEPGGRVKLTACLPPETKRGTCTDLTLYRDEEDGNYLLAAFFTTGEEEDKAYTLHDTSPSGACSVMLPYFEEGKVPDVSTWKDQSYLLHQEGPMEDYVLYVDGHEYEHIIYEDVQASLQDLDEGKCKSILLRTPSWQNGYMEVRGTRDDYVVEVAGFDHNHEVCGYRTHTIYGGHVTYWLSEYYHHYKYPEIRDDWEDVTEEVKRLATSD